MSEELLDYEIEDKGAPKISVPQSDWGLNRNTKYDLWAPLWILITFNVFLFVFGFISINLSSYFDNTKTDNKMKVTNTASITFTYSLFVPFGLYLFFRIVGNGHIRSSFLYILAVYLYGMAPYVPATVLFCLPMKTAKWLVMIVAGICSLVFITKELFVMARSNLDNKNLYIVCGLMILLHFGFIYLLHS